MLIEAPALERALQVVLDPPAASSRKGGDAVSSRKGGDAVP